MYVCTYLFKERVGLPFKREIWAMDRSGPEKRRV